MTTPPNNPEGYQPYSGAPGPTGPQPTPPNTSPTPPNPPASQQPAYPPPYGAPPPPYPPPPYSQPPYGAPFYPPVYVPPPPQPTRRSNAVWIIPVSIIVAVLLICGACSALAYYAISNGARAFSTTLGVTETYTGFCVDESSQNYQSAYTYFSTNLQQQMTSAAFAQRATQLDQRDGLISSCLAQPGTVPQISGSSAIVPLEVTRTPSANATPTASPSSPTSTPTVSPTTSTPTTITGPTPTTERTYTGSLHLIMQGSVWRIDQIDSSLDLT